VERKFRVSSRLPNPFAKTPQADTLRKHTAIADRANKGVPLPVAIRTVEAEDTQTRTFKKGLLRIYRLIGPRQAKALNDQLTQGQERITDALKRRGQG